jgi:hypothetical protein
MEKIHCIDNFLSNEELEHVHNILKNRSWTFYHTSNGDMDHEVPFWTTYLNEEKYISEYIKSIIEKHFFKKFNLLRVYCNGQTFGQDGAYHKDSEENDCYTFCLYINNVKKHDIELAGGHIYFKLPDLNYKICYEPINNRGIFFPSSYIHKSSAFSRFIMDMRMCIAWKLKEIK